MVDLAQLLQRAFAEAEHTVGETGSATGGSSSAGGFANPFNRFRELQRQRRLREKEQQHFPVRIFEQLDGEEPEQRRESPLHSAVDDNGERRSSTDDDGNPIFQFDGGSHADDGGDGTLFPWN